MAADDMALCVARPSAYMLLTMQDENIFVFHKFGFQIPEPIPLWKRIENANVFYVS